MPPHNLADNANDYNSPESTNHLEGGYASRVNVADVSAAEKAFNFINQGWPLVGEIARDDILECAGKLNGNHSGWGGRN